MSIFDKQASALTTQDLIDLLDGGAVENVRLEYKRDAPPKDEALKKLTSFANTYGGIMIIGAEAGNDGKLTAIPGVEPAPGIKQQIIQWCFDGTYPPLQPYISDAIPTPTDPSKACYVVHIEESEEAPHFLNGRKGAFVRSDEFSQRFKPELATYEELQHLGNRRQLLADRRTAQKARAKTRFETYASLHYKNTPGAVGDIGAASLLQISPVFPARQLTSQSGLFDTLTSKVLDWRQVGFPRVSEPITQHESVLLLGGEFGFSIVEGTLWGLLSYAREVEELRKDDSGKETRAIHLYAFLGHVLVALEHARVLYPQLGYEGSLDITLELSRIRALPFADFPGNSAELGPASPIDDSVSISLRTTTNRLNEDRDGVAKELLHQLFFALNWQAQARNDAVLLRLIQCGYYYNLWRKTAP